MNDEVDSYNNYYFFLTACGEAEMEGIKDQIMLAQDLLHEEYEGIDEVKAWIEGEILASYPG